MPARSGLAPPPGIRKDTKNCREAGLRTKTDIIKLVKDLPSFIDDPARLNGFESLDGLWAAQTREIYDQLACKAVNLSPLWLLTPQNWRCPICERGKKKILREAGGVLLGRIVEHHDHIDQFLEEESRAALAKAGQAEPSADVHRHIKHRCGPFLERFQPTVVCEDCNVADPAAMADCRGHGVGLEFFSFSPLEIASFIKTRPGEGHEIEFSTARAVVERQRENHLFRMKVGRTLVERALEGRIWAETPKGLSKQEVMILANGALTELAVTTPSVQRDEPIPRRAIERIQVFKSDVKAPEEALEHKRERLKRRAIRRAEKEAKKATGPAPNQGRAWSKEEEKELLVLHQKETPIPEMALKLGRKEGGIRARLEKLGIQVPISV